MTDPDEEWNAREYQDRIKDLETKIEQLTELAEKYKWQVRDTCTRAEIAERERDALVLSTGEHITKRSEYLTRAEKAEQERDALREALQKIASQKTSAELGKEENSDFYYDADFEYAFDTIVAIARAALEAKP